MMWERQLMVAYVAFRRTSTFKIQNIKKIGPSKMAPRLAASWAKLPPATSFLLPDSLLPLIAKRGVKYGWNTAPARSKPTRFNQPTASVPKSTTGPAAALARKANTLPLRTGALAIKKGCRWR